MYMKTSKLFLALALPVAFTACTNDDFSEVSGQQGADARLVELGENFVLGVQGVDGTQTKGVWEAGQNGAFNWSWIPEIGGATSNNMLGSSLTVNADEIGLCWTGELPDGTGSIGQRVYTNYQFIHDGWLAKGQTEANFNECNFELENGKRYADINADLLSNTSTLTQIKTQLADNANKVTIGTTPTELDLNTGVFKTENKAIFGGSYVVYYPYDDTFKDAGYVPASSEVNFTEVVTSKPETTTGANDGVPATAVLSERSIAENTYLVGYAKDIVGGSEASKLSLNPLSGIISLQLVSATGADATTKKITKVALYSKNGFVKNVGLDANKIKSLGADGGEALYVEGTKETTSTIVASIASASQQALSSTKQIMFLPALPTTAKDLEVILFADDNSIARINMNIDLTITPAAGKSVVVTVKESNFSANTLVAVDSESLEKALGSADATALTTIEVIGDITLNKNLTVYNNQVIKGDNIIVPEGKTLTLQAAAAQKAAATIQSKVIVEGKGCCGNADGKIEANGGILNDVDNYGEINVEGALTVNGTLKNLVDAEDTDKTTNEATLTVADNAGNLTLAGTLENEAVMTNLNNVTMNPNSKIVNKGTITNEGMFFNNSTRANFENHDTYVDKLGYLLSGQLLTNVGETAEYICEVDTDETRLNYALIQRSMVTTVRFVDTGWYDFSPFAGKDFSDLKFEVDATGAVGFVGNNETVVNNTPVAIPMELKIKSLTVNSSLRINRNGVLSGSVTTDNNQLKLNVVEDVVVNAGTFSIEQPVLATIGGNLTINGTYTPLEGAKVEVGDRTAENGKMYIGATGVATIAPNVQMNVYGTVDKAVKGTFTYTTASGTQVSGEVRCKSYNTSAGWTAGQAPIVDAYFTFE